MGVPCPSMIGFPSPNVVLLRSAAHHVYGVPQTINTAEYIFVQAIGEVAKLRPTRSDSEPDLHRIVNGKVFFISRFVRCCLFARAIDELQNLHRGQGLEIIWRDSLKCPSVDEYIDMANKSSYSYTGFFPSVIIEFSCRDQRSSTHCLSSHDGLCYCKHRHVSPPFVHSCLQLHSMRIYMATDIVIMCRSSTRLAFSSKSEMTS